MTSAKTRIHDLERKMNATITALQQENQALEIFVDAEVDDEGNFAGGVVRETNLKGVEYLKFVEAMKRSHESKASIVTQIEVFITD